MPRRRGGFESVADVADVETPIVVYYCLEGPPAHNGLPYLDKSRLFESNDPTCPICPVCERMVSAWLAPNLDTFPAGVERLVR